MFVIKRNGNHEKVDFGKITARIERLCFGLDASFVDPARIAKRTCAGVYAGVTTHELDDLAAETAAHLTSTHPDMGILAARICVSRMHKETNSNFAQNAKLLFEHVDKKTNLPAPLLSQSVYSFISDHASQLNDAIDYDKDFNYDYFGFKTLERAYLMKRNGKIEERPQQMLMRVACGIHTGDLKSTIETYNLLSEGWFTHASPTLFNSGTTRPQFSSCFLLTMKADSIEGIYDTLKNCALISKNAGGIGLSAHKIRSKGSYIRGTGGVSNGLIPMLRVFNATARYVDQGGGKRKGAFAIYVEPWHADIEEFLQLRKNHGAEENRARDLFLGLWVPDLFMQRVEKDEIWSLMCPSQSPGLADVYGKEFDAKFTAYENSGRFVKQLPARSLWQKICESQIETGTPYMMFKDACNRKSNQNNLGTIRSSNLCTEIVEYTAPDEVAVCNLASLALPKFVVQSTETKSLHFDHERLRDVTKIVTKNLNKIIDRNFYPIPEAKNSNLRHRPIGIGIQGLADVFCMLNMPFDCPDARRLNAEIFETIYFAACEQSMELAMQDGPYSSFSGSPMSKGKFQFDLWGVTPGSHRWDWDALRQKVMTHGMRNSLLVAPMPTASTSQILGNNECFEPFTSNIYIRRTHAGEFVCVNKHLLRELIALGLWTNELKQEIIANNGSIQSLTQIPKHVRDVFRTVWEIKQRSIIDMAADRGAFICQSQSMNIHATNVTFAKLNSIHFHGWRRGLKTGMYYLRTKSAVDAIKFTVDLKKNKEAHEQTTTTTTAATTATTTTTAAQDLTTTAAQNQKPSKQSLPVVCNDEICVSCSG